MPRSVRDAPLQTPRLSAGGLANTWLPGPSGAGASAVSHGSCFRCTGCRRRSESYIQTMCAYDLSWLEMDAGRDDNNHFKLWTGEIRPKINFLAALRNIRRLLYELRPTTQLYFFLGLNKRVSAFWHCFITFKQQTNQTAPI